DSVQPPVAQTYGSPLRRCLAERAETPQEWREAPLRGGSAIGSEQLEGSTIRRSDARTTAFRINRLPVAQLNGTPGSTPQGQIRSMPGSTARTAPGSATTGAADSRNNRTDHASRSGTSRRAGRLVPTRPAAAT